MRRLPTGARLEMLISTRRLWVEFWLVMAERSPVEMQVCCVVRDLRKTVDLNSIDGNLSTPILANVPLAYTRILEVRFVYVHGSCVKRQHGNSAPLRCV